MPDGSPNSSSVERGRRSAASLSPIDLARLLSASGARHVSAESILRDIESGAPTNADGTLSLVHYGAWLARQAAVQETGKATQQGIDAAESAGAHGH
jgi:hypothetical protein